MTSPVYRCPASGKLILELRWKIKCDCRKRVSDLILMNDSRDHSARAGSEWLRSSRTSRASPPCEQASSCVQGWPAADLWSGERGGSSFRLTMASRVLASADSIRMRCTSWAMGVCGRIPAILSVSAARLRICSDRAATTTPQLLQPQTQSEARHMLHQCVVVHPA